MYSSISRRRAGVGSGSAGIIKCPDDMETMKRTSGGKQTTRMKGYGKDCTGHGERLVSKPQAREIWVDEYIYPTD